MLKGSVKEEAVASGLCSQAHQAHDSMPQSNVTAGTCGVAGCPEHHAPLHGRGGL
jgi:hypothetical protein